MESTAVHVSGLSALIAHFYDAAIDATLWPGTAARIAQAFGSTSTVVKLHGECVQVNMLECTGNLKVSDRDQAWADDWHRRDLWVERSVAYGMSRVITDEDLVTPEEQARSGTGGEGNQPISCNDGRGLQVEIRVTKKQWLPGGHSAASVLEISAP